MGPKSRTRSEWNRTLLPVAAVVALLVLGLTTYALIDHQGDGTERTAASTELGGQPTPPQDTAQGTATPTPTTTTPAQRKTPTPTPTATPAAAKTKAAAARATGGLPGASNTGVPKGTTLKRSGSLTITKAGTVIDRMDVHGCIEVLASNVTIRRTRVRGDVCGADHSIDIGYGSDKYHGILIEDVELDGLRIQARGAAIGNSGFTCRRCNIHSTGKGVQMGTNVTVEDSYIHDLYGTSVSENAPIQSNGGSHYAIRHNNLVMDDMPGGTTSLALFGEFDPITDVLVEGNLFNGGTYCVYAGSDPTKKYRLGTRIRFLDNAFGRTLHSKCGQYGPATAWSSAGSGNHWSGNHWADTKRTISASSL
jgi:hypothetical protein